MRDYLTMDDDELTAFSGKFINGIGEMAEVFAFSPETIAELTEFFDEFREINDEIKQERLRMKVLTAKKAAVRSRLKKKIRSLAAITRTQPNAADSHFIRLGLKVHDRTRTARRTPDSVPQVRVQIKPHRQHIIEISDMANLSVRAKPAGVSGAEIWVGIGAGDEGWSEKNMRYLSTATRHRLTHIHDVEDGGKQAFYMARWATSNGKRGGWSRMTSATIAV